VNRNKPKSQMATETNSKAVEGKQEGRLILIEILRSSKMQKRVFLTTPGDLLVEPRARRQTRAAINQQFLCLE
jgi:hypothetical protein